MKTKPIIIITIIVAVLLFCIPAFAHDVTDDEISTNSTTNSPYTYDQNGMKVINLSNDNMTYYKIDENKGFYVGKYINPENNEVVIHTHTEGIWSINDKPLEYYLEQYGIQSCD